MFNFGHHGQNQPAHPPAGVGAGARGQSQPAGVLNSGHHGQNEPAGVFNSGHHGQSEPPGVFNSDPPAGVGAAAVGVTSYLLVAVGAASGDRSLRRSIKHSSVDRLRFKTRTPHFLVLCLVMGALPYAGQLVAAARELHLYPAMVACIVLTVAGLFHWAVLSLNFLVARQQAEEEPKPQARPAATTAAPTTSASRLAHPHFLVPCLVVGALPYAEQLVTAAGEFHIHPAMVACIVLAVAGLFDWAVLSLNFVVARRQAEEEPKRQARPAATTAAPTVSASRLAHPHFLVLCLVVGALPYAEQLVTAARELHLHLAMVACIVLAFAGLFHWADLSLNFLVARRHAEVEPKPQPRPAATTAAPTAPASRLPLLPFLVLALAIAAAMVAGPAVAAEAIHLPLNAAVWACLALAVSFHVAIGSIYCFVVNQSPPAVAGAEPRSRSAAPGAIGASLVSASIVGVTSYLLIAGGAASGDISARI